MVSKTAVAADAERRAPAATRWVVFRCAGRLFGISIEHVSEILGARPFTRLPGCGPAVCGLIGVRGIVITVLDLGVLLEAAPSGSMPDHSLLLLDIGDQRIAAAVDQIVEIVPARIRAAGDDPDAATGGDPAAAAALGAGQSGAGEFIALDPARLLVHMLQQ
jgi:purine-binding chemotaxis protein CheW